MPKPTVTNDPATTPAQPPDSLPDPASWNDLLREVADAADPAALAGAAVRLGEAHEAAGRPAEAWATFDEAERQAALAGDAAALEASRAGKGRVEAVVFPPFVDAADLETAWNDLADRLLAAAQDAFAGRAAADPGAAVPAVAAARRAFRLRLAATLDASGPSPAPLVDLARAFPLSSEDVETLLLLHRMEVSAAWDRSVRSLGREEFLPAPTVRFLCRFLGGEGRVLRAWARRFLPSGPLLRFGLVDVGASREAPGTDPLPCLVRPAADVLAMLDGDDPAGILAAAGLAAVPVPPGDPLHPEAVDGARRWMETASGVDRLLLVSTGPKGAVLDLARAASAVGIPVVRGDARLGGSAAGLALVGRTLRAAWLAGAMPVLVLRDEPGPSAAADDASGPRVPPGDPQAGAEALARELAGWDVPVALVAGPDALTDLVRAVDRLTVVPCGRPAPDLLAPALARALADQGVTAADPGVLVPVLSSEAVEFDGVEDLAREVAAGCRQAGRSDLDPSVLRRAARTRSSTAFSGIAERLVTNVGWADLVVPDEVLVTLNDVITFARYRDRVMGDWGFAERMPYGRALSALFQGPPGTGKTLAACVLANELGVDLFRVDLSQIVSKWVGETEKNLARVFEAASRTRGIVLFDEADALFGKRTEVRTAVDRYSNLEVNYLLQRLEDFDGLAVMTTNYPENIDAAFRRRIRFKVAFPFPDEALRLAMWKRLLPPRVPVEGVLDFKAIARRFEFAGAHVRNAILRAAFRAAADDRGVCQEDLVEAARAEAQEAGILVRA